MVRLGPMVCAVAAAGAVLATALPAAAAPPERANQGSLVIKTVPPTPGARFSADGVIARSDRTGVATLPVRRAAGLDARFHVLQTRVASDKMVSLDRLVGGPERAVGGRPLVAGLRTQRLVRWSFVDRGGKSVPPERVTELVIRSNTGETLTLRGADLVKPRWLAASRTQQTPSGLVSKDLRWSVLRAVVDGAEVVNKGQQVFVPNEQRQWTIALLFYRVRVTGQDLLFGGTAGTGVELHRPDGRTVRTPFVDGSALLPDVPRGHYEIQVYGAGVSFLHPASISKDQTLEIQVITVLDLALISFLVVFVAGSLVLVGRRRRVSALRRRFRRAAPRAAVVLAVVALVPLVPVAERPAEAASPPPVPVLAYYYIWYNPTSWQRAKSDYPLLGRYSSDDVEVMRRHVTMARSAGVTGFLVSWKHTDALDARLAQLVQVARAQGFKLGIVYQGLDFSRNKLPAARVAEDLRFFADRYASDPVFNIFGKPVVAITGTEQYSVDELRQAAAPVRSRIMVLASAKKVDDYERVASVVDGEAYYWSSADPDAPSFRSGLLRMGDAVHAHDGLWLAPAAAGFDARLIGGRRVIPRKKGDTLRREVDAARASSPDGLAVISWNEFSENSHIEPSQREGTTALETLADILGARVDLQVPEDSSEPVRAQPGLTGWGALVLVGFLISLLNLVVLLRRRRRGRLDVEAGTS